jgi:glutamine synthetase
MKRLTRDDVLKTAEKNDVRLIRFLYCDPSGMIRGKTAHGSQLNSKIDEGLGLTRAQNAVNVFEDLIHIEDMIPVGELRVVPDPATYTELPWLDRTASFICDQMEYDYTPNPTCSRSILKRAIAYAAENGLKIFSSFENEFYLATKDESGYHPFNDGPVYSSSGMDRVAHVIHDMVDNLTVQGMVVEQAINEYGPGQQEIAIRYTDALASADNQIKFRDTVRGTAEITHGLHASFAPKPFADGIGSGAHLHFSVWSMDESKNLLYNSESPDRLSKFGMSFVAGILEHLPALIAITCPSYNSYDRLKPDSWAGNTVSWGYDNRECTVRVASPFRGRESESINLELKACDGSSNPYLVLAALIYAGIDGIKRDLQPPSDCKGNPARLTDAEMVACGIKPLPTDQMQAHELLSKDPVMVTALGEKMIECLVALRGAEYRKAKDLGDDWARNAFFNVL